MKNIIVTGSSGFIGSALKTYLEKDYRIIGIDRKGYLSRKTKDFYLQDINDGLPDLMDVDEIYAVIHLAALPGVRDSHKNFKQVCMDNILATQRVIQKCIDNWKPKKLLVASSSSVYGNLGKDGHALKEDEGVSPVSPYAMSKVATENLLVTYKNCGLLKDIDATSLRFFTVYGPHQRNELAIRAFTDWILQDKPITLYGTGKQVRDFTHIDDICSGIKRLLKWDDPYKYCYNIGSNDTHSINEIIHMICDITGKDVTINYQPRSIWDVDATNADISRIGKDWGWYPKVKFEDGLKGQIEWQKKELGL
jgi:nucleoside-diphosphate-sugar epimerase